MKQAFQKMENLLYLDKEYMRIFFDALVAHPLNIHISWFASSNYQIQRAKKHEKPFDDINLIWLQADKIMIIIIIFSGGFNFVCG